jgi:CRISPR-associated protein Cas2
MPSAYQIMWVLVFFDLPVGSKSERRTATGFRKLLLDEGFIMKQFSVYLRSVNNRNVADALAQRISRYVPPEGDVSIMFFTDKQYGLTKNFYGKVKKEAEKPPNQLLLF